MGEINEENKKKGLASHFQLDCLSSRKLSAWFTQMKGNKQIIRFFPLLSVCELHNL